MEDICSCYDCERSFKRCIENLNLRQYKRDIKIYCSKCNHPSCLNHEAYKFLCLNYPNNSFTKDILLNPGTFPRKLRPGICNYMAEKNYWE